MSLGGLFPRGFMEEELRRLGPAIEEGRRRYKLHRRAEYTGAVCERCEANICPGEPVWRVWSAVNDRPYHNIWCFVTMCEECGREFRDRCNQPISINGRAIFVPDRRHYLETECEECGRAIVFGLLWTRRHRRRFCSGRCATKHYVGPHNDRRAARRAEARASLTCATCDQLLTASRSDAKYCSAACRQRAYRQRTARAR